VRLAIWTAVSERIDEVIGSHPAGNGQITRARVPEPQERMTTWCGVASRYLPSSAQTTDAWTDRSCASRAPVGAGMFSDVVTDRRPSAVAAAHCT